MLTREGVLAALEQAGALPTLPGVYQRIRALAADPSSTAADLGKVVSEDPALASRLLRLVNSSFYGLPGKIASLSRAAVMVGFKALEKLALTASVVELFRGRGGPGLDLAGLWEHSLATALLARALARQAGVGQAEEVFAAGLLHDIGKLVLSSRFPGPYGRALARTAGTGVRLCESERDQLQVDHAEAGGILARKWGLPPLLLEAIEHHHDPQRAPGCPRETAVVQVADALAIGLAWGCGGSPWVPGVDREAFSRTGIAAARVDEVMPAVEGELAQLRGILHPAAS